MNFSNDFPSLERLAVVEGFGGAIRRPAYVYRPTDVGQIEELFRLASSHGYRVGFFGAGRSYGDAPLNSGNVLLDLRSFNRILEWNPETGVIRMEPGVTIQQLWQHILEDGWWPPVVPGTMSPTVGGCLAMNVHGKNNYQQGTFGEHVLEFTALLPTGEEIACTPQKHNELFYSLISSMGLLGVFTSITMQMRRIYSGDLYVHAWTVTNLRQMIEDIERLKAETDYIVGWVDCLASGPGLGRGQLHSADYLAPGQDPDPSHTLRVSYQTLPDTFFGLVPASDLWRLMAPWMNRPGVRLINLARYLLSATVGNHKRFRQPHAAFHFLLDYIPNWRQAYGAQGLIQYQCFLPQDVALDVFCELLRLTQRQRLPSFLGVIKRHRLDKFLFTHAVDGFSLALDFKVTRHNRPALQRLAGEMNELVLEAGGRFYFAKDSTLTPEVAVRFLGEGTLTRFRELKARCDPEGLLQNDLYRRLLAQK